MEINVSKVARYNGMNSSKPCADFVGKELQLVGMFTFNDDVVNNETGEVKNKELICLITEEGCIASPSPTLVDSAKKLADIFDDDIVGMSIKIVGQKSNAGRTFYRLEVIE